MLVGEPTLMGGELGDEDERLISRLENNQYKPAVVDDEEMGTTGQPGYNSLPPIQSAWSQDMKPPNGCAPGDSLAPSNG